MSDTVRVHNRGIRAIVYERSFRGIKVLHPKKTVAMSEDQAKSVIDRFDDAVREGVREQEPVRRARPAKEKEED